MSFGHKAFPPAARLPVVRMLAARTLAACAFVAMLAVLLMPAAAAEAVFPTGSRLGLAPPPGLQPARSFPGFEDLQNGVFVRLIALPANAFPEIEKTMTNEALKKQGMTVEKRESLPLRGEQRHPRDRAAGDDGGPHPQMAADRDGRQSDRAGLA